jgi:sterol 24-C-methyltransferase
LIGAVTTPSPRDFEVALEKAGFKILKSRDASVNGHQADLIEKAVFFFTKL